MESLNRNFDMLRDHLKTIRKLLLIAHLCLVALSFHAAILVNSFIKQSIWKLELQDSLLIAIVIIWGTILWFSKECFLFRSKSYLEVLKSIVSASLKASAVFLIYLYLIKHPEKYQLEIGIFLLLSFVSLLILQLSINFVLRHYRKLGYNYQTVLIVGNGNKAKKFAEKILNNAYWGLKIIGFIECNTEPGQKNGTKLWRYRDIPNIGSVNDLPDIIKSQQVDQVVFALENDRLAQVEQAVIECQEMGTEVIVLANLFPARYSSVKVEKFYEYPVLLYDTTKHKNALLIIKELFDRVAATAGLIFLSPILLLVSILIKIFSKGSILFIQERLGRNGKKFNIYKFRTMVPDAEKLQHKFKKLNEMDGPVFKIEKDPRITPIGRWLRKTSIDELPQLLNVFKGDMSLVGPRPPLLKEVKDYDPWQRRRLSFKPGLTCLWQVNGRNNLNFEKWMKLDMQYIDNWSLWLDTKILAKTIPVVLSRKGAK